MPLTYEIPPRETPKDDNGYFEQMTKAIFQAGFSWLVIRNKWENFQKAFDHFDINKVSDYNLDDILRLVCDKGIVRNRQKIGATIENANLIKQLIEEHGSFKKYLDFLPSDYYERAPILTKRFKNLGRTSAFVYLYCVNEPVSEWQER
ncbi:MAG: DNA-3-methyladenine glycosylase I [Candidatus Marinimicrobia bacterium]|nr:DNA-3-methyladenine glycosylase I [Candidatus Neomarinimicrobiota bacterium]